MLKYVLISITCCFIMADDYPELNGGRPGQAETITIVPTGYYQFETNISPSDKVGGLMFRTGVSSNIETRFSLDDISTAGTSTNIGGITAGLLMHVSEEKGIFPGIGAALSISVPNTNDLQIDNSQIDLVIPFTKGISDNFGIDWHLAASQVDASQLFSFASFFGYSITDELGIFFGLYGGSIISKISDMSLSLDSGCTYNIRKNIQLDISGGIAITENGEDSFVDMGIVFRLPY